MRKSGGAWQTRPRATAASSVPATTHALRVSKHVNGLRAGVRYEFRLGADPGGAGRAAPLLQRAALSSPTASARVWSRLPTTPGLRWPPGRSAPTSCAWSSTSMRRWRRCAATIDHARRAAGARALLLAGFEGRIPTEAEAQNLASWAAEFGPGGRFWAGPLRRPAGGAADRVRQRDVVRLPVRRHLVRRVLREPRRAVRHALRAGAPAAIAMTGRDVGLLAQADDGGSGSTTWVDHMFRAVPNLGRSSTGGRSTRTGRARAGSRSSTG